MNTNLVIAIIGATGVVTASIVSNLRYRENERNAISKDLAIYKLLPKESSVREALLKRIDENVANSLIFNRSIRRDIPGAITQLISTVAGVGTGFVIIALTSPYNWNWLDFAPPIIYPLLAVVPLFYCLLVIASKLEVRLRDEKGNPVKKPYKRTPTTQRTVSLWGRSLLQPAKKRGS